MKLRSFLQAVPVLLLALSLAGPAWGAGGTGAGGGGGPAVPLTMDWSFPADGERNVSLTPIIQCKFSHNVAHSTVQRRNKTLVSLTKADSSPVAYQVYQVDAQIEFSKRQYIYILPTGPLEANTTYTVHVEEGVQAKNGMATEEAQSFSFTTGSGAVPSVPLMVETAPPAVSREPDGEAGSQSPAADHVNPTPAFSSAVPSVSASPVPSAAVSASPAPSAGPSQTAESAAPPEKAEETAAPAPSGTEAPSGQETAAPAESPPAESAPPVSQAEGGTGWLLPAGLLLAVCLGFAGLYFRKR